MFEHSRRNLAHWFALSMGGILFAFAGVGYNAQCPMPNAQCPMPNAQCPMTNV
ncbi:hypothetical protein [Nostoc linckia]|uniref:hypothetical protein n=1 Tax=Nostoc linckia TaxID=92942 RepID=UPI0015D51A4A|nr:hypothetical protein [Nostoc linckia]